MEPQRPRSPFAEFVGCELVAAGGGEARARMRYRPEHDNIHGTIHGGAIATLADFALGWAVRAALPAGTRLATVELKINYLRPARGDLEARARVLHQGRTLAVVEADVVDAAGAPVARVLSTFAIGTGRREGTAASGPDRAVGHDEAAAGEEDGHGG
ncbi:MAG: PaaI family thioesterase [Firmicutes bacterium]|nr:PaaI family thioesterase [Bacillota bacterium]